MCSKSTIYLGENMTKTNKIDNKKVTAIAIKIMEKKIDGNFKNLTHCPNCRHRLHPVDNFFRCPKCNNDFIKTCKGTYIWDKSAGDTTLINGVPHGEWVEWKRFEPEIVEFT